jgi:hypothetical protein
VECYKFTELGNAERPGKSMRRDVDAEEEVERVGKLRIWWKESRAGHRLEMERTLDLIVIEQNGIEIRSTYATGVELTGI